MNLSRIRSSALGSTRSKVVAGSALAAVLLVGGGVAVSSVASAEESSAVATASASSQTTPDDELASLTAAVLAEYPGATVLGAEVDTEGGYHAHVTTADGDLLLVDLDADLTVTGSSTDAGPGAAAGDAAPEGGAPQDDAASTSGT